jgi:hypothetical protein
MGERTERPTGEGEQDLAALVAEQHALVAETRRLIDQLRRAIAEAKADAKKVQQMAQEPTETE